MPVNNDDNVVRLDVAPLEPVSADDGVDLPDSVVLRAADKLLSKYFHPSRFGGPPTGAALEGILNARAYVQLARRMAEMSEQGKDVSFLSGQRG